MDFQNYKEKTEKDLVNKFLKNFHERLGYYPTVITNADLKEDSLNVLSLEELGKYFTPYLPKAYGKIVALGSKLRVREIIELRQMFCSIARNIGFSLKSIGVYLGNRDHTTIIHALRSFGNLMETDPTYREKYNNIINKIKADGNYYNSSTMVGNYKK